MSQDAEFIDFSKGLQNKSNINIIQDQPKAESIQKPYIDAEINQSSPFLQSQPTNEFQQNAYSAYGLFNQTFRNLAEFPNNEENCTASANLMNCSSTKSSSYRGFNDLYLSDELLIRPFNNISLDADACQKS